MLSIVLSFKAQQTIECLLQIIIVVFQGVYSLRAGETHSTEPFDRINVIVYRGASILCRLRLLHWR